MEWRGGGGVQKGFRVEGLGDSGSGSRRAAVDGYHNQGSSCSQVVPSYTPTYMGGRVGLYPRPSTVCFR